MMSLLGTNAGHLVRSGVLGLGLLAALCGGAMAVQTDTHGLHAVPAPGAVAIDGKLDEWELSGASLMCYDVEALKDVYSATVAMMYDGTNLYVGIHWKDSNPMGNIHDPRYQSNMGWAGDSVQLRIKTDRISHVTAWYYAGGKEPAMHLDYGKSLSEPFDGGDLKLYSTGGWKLQEGAEMAFLKDADGKGYVQEMKIPWKLITLKKIPVAGERFVCGIELLWGEANWPVHRYADNLSDGASSREFFWTAHNNWGSVTMEAKGKLTLPEPLWAKNLRQQQPQGPIDIAYELPKDARVTLALDDASHKRVRNLVAAQDRVKGKNVEHWDGLDDNGQPLPPGEYQFSAIYHDGIHLNYAMSFANPGKPTWQTSDGRGSFYADHSAAQGVAAGGDYLAFACPIGEAGPSVIGCDLTGQRLWGLANRVSFDGGHISLATDGKTLWVGDEGKSSIVYRVEVATGRYAPWQKLDKDDKGNEFRVLDLRVSDRPGAWSKFDAGDPGKGSVLRPNLSAIAWHAGELAVCLYKENKIKLMDAEAGTIKKELQIPEPQSAAYDADGTLIVLSQGKLIRVGVDGRMTAFTQQAFPEGYGLAVDADRKVYLSVRGAEQNVKVFATDGSQVREIGKRGGRPLNGAYDADAMREPAQIAIDSKGQLWVAEETMNPKRVSVWSLADGKLVKDLPGSTTYCGSGSINPLDPTMAFSDDTVYQIDLGAGSWRPVYSLGSTRDPADIFAAGGSTSVGVLAGRADSHTRVVKRNDATFVYSTSSARGSQETHCLMLKDGVWRSAAHTGVVVRKNEGEWAKYLNPLFAGQDGKAYAWSDANGDGLVQADELAFADLTVDGKRTSLQSFYWGQLPDVDGTIIYMAQGAGALLKFPITALTACGAPKYDIAHPQIVKLDRPVLGGGNNEGMVMGGSDGRVYLNQDPVITVEKNGHVLGGYPNKHTSVHGSHTALAARSGYLIGPSMILGTADMGGEIGEIFDMNGNLGQNYLFTADGLWIQSLLKDIRGGFDIPSTAARGMPMDLTTAGGESFGGNFVRIPDGRVYLTVGQNDAKVLEVVGLDTIKRFAGSFTFTPEQYVKAQQFVQQQAAEAMVAKVYTIEQATSPLAIDGQSAKWPELLDDARPAIDIQQDAQHRFGRAQLRYDQQNLYVAYRVVAPDNRLRNVGQADKLMFKTGDCVDLMLGANTGTGKDACLRLLMTVADGKPVIVLYEQNIPGVAAADRAAFSSPWRTIYIDRVTRPAGVKLASSPVAGGYFVEAAIPWQVLGIAPRAGLKLKGDVGILSADRGGTTTVSRQYWSNKATGLVNDIPGEAELTPKLWGEFVLR